MAEPSAATPSPAPAPAPTPADDPAAKPVSKKQKYRKDKPWDTPDIDHWKIDDFKPEHSSGPFLEESSFATLFPQYREKYLREIWKAVTVVLDKHAIKCTLNVIEGSMTVRTTRKTWDPFAVMKARDLIKLLARSVPLAQGIKIMNDDMQCDIVKIAGFTRNRERFVKRRQRLMGPNGSTLKAVEMLTACYILVQGNTVSCMGTFKGLKQARRIIEDCMKNVHPVYNIKALMIKRELSKDDALKEQSWDRFLPKFKKSNPKKSKKRPREAPKPYTPFPPLPTQSKVDMQLESGEYFMNDELRKRSRVDTNKKRSEETAAKRKEAREQAYTPPEEKEYQPAKKKARVEDPDDDPMALALKVKKKLKKKRKQ